jgi:hypothetical protein
VEEPLIAASESGSRQPSEAVPAAREAGRGGAPVPVAASASTGCSLPSLLPTATTSVRVFGSVVRGEDEPGSAWCSPTGYAGPRVSSMPWTRSLPRTSRVGPRSPSRRRPPGPTTRILVRRTARSRRDACWAPGELLSARSAVAAFPGAGQRCWVACLRRPAGGSRVCSAPGQSVQCMLLVRSRGERPSDGEARRAGRREPGTRWVIFGLNCRTGPLQ